MSNSLQLQGLQHARLFCPSPSPRVCSNSCPLRQWCHPTTSSFVIPLLLLSSIFPRIRVFSNDLALHIRCCILCLGCIQKMRTEAHPYCKQYSLVCVLILHCVNVICTNTKVFSKVTGRCAVWTMIMCLHRTQDTLDNPQTTAGGDSLRNTVSQNIYYRNKKNNNKWGPNQIYKFFHSKWNHKQNEKTTYRKGENICKWWNQQWLNFQNIQTVHTI